MTSTEHKTSRNYSSRQLGRRLPRRVILRGAGAAGAGLALAACRGAGKGQSGAAGRGQAGSGPAQTGGTLTWFVNKNEELDPQKGSGADQRAVSGVYSRIFHFKTGVDPQVAAKYDLEEELGVSAESSDAITWTIKLRPDAAFHNTAPVNGHAVEAEDVKATFIRALDPATSSPNRGSLDMIDPAQIQTPDRATVVFKLRYPYAPFRKTLASAAYCLIMPREGATGAYDASNVAIGSGPFVLESYTPDVAAVFKKNPRYFVRNEPYVDGMRMAIVPDAAQQIAQFTGGNLDEIGATINQQFTAFDVEPMRRSNPRAVMLKVTAAIPNSILFQMGDPRSPFLDIRVRRAFSMAIDREVLSKTVWGGESEQVILVPSYMDRWALKVQDLDPDTQRYFKYNPAEAKKLLEAAGATNLQLRLTWANLFGTPPFVKQAETIGSFLNAAGIKTTLVVVDFNKDYIAGGKGMKNGFYPPDTVLLTAQAQYSEADEFLFNFFDSKSTSNNERLSDPIYDAMIEKERAIVNEDERLKAVLDAQRYLAEKMYPVPTVGTYRWVFLQPRAQNYQYSSTYGTGTETYSRLWLKG